MGEFALNKSLFMVRGINFDGNRFTGLKFTGLVGFVGLPCTGHRCTVKVCFDDKSQLCYTNEREIDTNCTI